MSQPTATSQKLQQPESNANVALLNIKSGANELELAYSVPTVGGRLTQRPNTGNATSSSHTRQLS